MEKFDLTALGQMSLDLDVEDDVSAEEVGALSHDEVQMRSAQARQLLEDGELWGEMDLWSKAPVWFDDYLKLRELGFRWRVAVFIAWAATPKADRRPKTQEELATKVLGLTSSQAISRWRRKDGRIDDAIAMMQAAPLWEHRADVLDALIEVATTPDYKSHNDRKLFLEMIGDYVPRSKLDVGVREPGDESELSDAELRKLAGAKKKFEPPPSVPRSGGMTEEDDGEEDEVVEERDAHAGAPLQEGDGDDGES